MSGIKQYETEYNESVSIQIGKIINQIQIRKRNSPNYSKDFFKQFESLQDVFVENIYLNLQNRRIKII
ncbi:MAG: hypothetical protein CL760_00860 [Chloroflexi bacterium]|nr:hypothetical protein [Chloroflexota bacterium]|tara:strand:+ start:27537 stop:27740 length:204 start_codon:yes stop_codon:yes gene_type:complete